MGFRVEWLARRAIAIERYTVHHPRHNDSPRRVGELLQDQDAVGIKIACVGNRPTAIGEEADKRLDRAVRVTADIYQRVKGKTSGAKARGQIEKAFLVLDPKESARESCLCNARRTRSTRFESEKSSTESARVRSGCFSPDATGSRASARRAASAIVSGSGSSVSASSSFGDRVTASQRKNADDDAGRFAAASFAASRDRAAEAAGDGRPSER